VVVNVPIPVSCVNDNPTRPVRDTSGTARDKLIKSYIFIEELEKYATRLEAIVIGCEKNETR
jgi:hypothetical protein